MTAQRANVVSSFTIIKGALIDETYASFQNWDFGLSRQENLARVKASSTFGALGATWARDVAKVLNRRFDPDGRDRPLVELARAGLEREIWKPLLLWHLTRDEFLVRDFLVSWLYPRYVEGADRLPVEEVVADLGSLNGRDGVEWSGAWTPTTTARVASGLLRIAADVGLLAGGAVKAFASYHLPEPSFLYLLHAMAETEPNVGRLITAPDWQMYLLDPDDVERQIVHLHQYRKLHYELAGSLAQLTLPCRTAAEFARELAA